MKTVNEQESKMKAKNTKNTSSKMRSAILKKRHLWKNKRGKVVETEQKMYPRVADGMTKDLIP
jgi:hypothetical protein